VKLSEDLTWRGLVKDKTFDDASWLDEPKTFYHGVDCSNSSLTIGNLAVLLLAKRMVNAGWQGVILVGGATSLVGDPGGKNEERELKNKSEIENNVSAIKAQIEPLFQGADVQFVNNIDWFGQIGYLDFLRDVGKHYSMTELTQRDYIAERMGEGGSGISYAEFSYTLIQGYDFWYLFKNYQTILQIGGSDQWGNMLSGVPLIRKKEGAEAHVLTMPLVVDKTTGIKFGKSEEGAIWLDANKTSPYQFYQFWLNTDDASVLDYLKIYTFLSHEEIGQLAEELKHNPEARAAQRRLASEITTLVHGKAIAASVQKITQTLFGGQDYHQLTEADFNELTKELKIVQAGPGSSLVDVLVQAGLAISNTEARRFLEDSAVYINGQQFALGKTALDETDFINGYVVVRRGKNAQAILKRQ
jgi:tyrosyl-tRNA synthetase